MFRTSPSAFLRCGLAALLALPLTACGGATPAAFNKGMQSVHQPVVSQSNYIYDVRMDDSAGLSAGERDRLNGWLDSLQVGYGDHLAIATDDAYVSPAMKDGIAAVLGQRGMLVEEDGSAAAGRAPSGSVRLILRRASAHVPGCPNWSDKQESYMSGKTSANFGCATNSNLAAMVANANDLVRGQGADSVLRTATSDKAIKTYREAPATGSGGLQSLKGQ